MDLVTDMHMFWELFQDSPILLRVVSLVQTGFTVWMVVDAYRRGAEFFWFWIVLFFQPLGAWIYFFAIKFQTLRMPRFRSAAPRERRRSIEELRYRLDHAPTMANRLALAECLMERGRHDEAAPHLDAVLTVEPGYTPALYSLAQCRLVTGRPEESVTLLERLIARDRRWSDYRAWRTLVDVHVRLNRLTDAVSAARELERHRPTLENRCVLAERLVAAGQRPEAVQLLERALADHQFNSSWLDKLRTRAWQREARRLIAQITRPGEKS